MSTATSPRPLIVVKRINRTAAAHHGGAWKIAYADFVTAMMAFFLLMWLLGSTAKGDLQGIAEYFQTPLKVAMQGGSGSGDSSSVIQGGGTDLTRSVGQVQKTDRPSEKRTINLRAAQAELERIEMARLVELKGKLEAAIDANAVLRTYRNQIRVDFTQEGLRVQIVDEQNRPMFDSGSAVLKEYTREILRELASLLNDVPNQLSLSGHTDANPYAAGERGYSNWELSADRANSSRRELIAGGIDEKKIIRVVGQGAAVMLDKGNPVSPINRRISIIVLNHNATQRILDEHPQDGSMTGLQEEDAPAQAGAAPPAKEGAAAPSPTPAPMALQQPAAQTPQQTVIALSPATAAGAAPAK